MRSLRFWVAAIRARPSDRLLDASALIAILLGESSAAAVSEVLETSTATAIPAPTLVGTLIVAEARLGAQGALNVERIMRIADVETVHLMLRMRKPPSKPGADTGVAGTTLD